MLATISLRAIRENARAVCAAAGAPLIAVVKDDAYGHGAAEVAHALTGIASSFAVSTVDEGAALRISGVREGVLVLTPPLSVEEVVRGSEYGLTLSVTSRAVLALIKRAGCRPQCELAVNTGMNRYGVRPSLVGAACREALRAGICMTGVYSHLYLAEDGAARAQQAERFLQAVHAAREVFPQLAAHLSGTGGAIAGDAFDGVRAGIALYGYLPAGFEGRLSLHRAAKVYATVSHSCRRVGEGAGYARAACERTFHTLRMGYGDGFFRCTNGRPLCMDACVLAGRAKIGRRKLILSDFSAYAREQGTSVYEALVKLLKGTVKVYV